MQILGKDYVVWDKATEIKFKRPAYKNAFAVFEFSAEEIEEIKHKVAVENEVNHTKKLFINNNENVVFSELDKVLYISSKEHYIQKK
ncbi:hypothetical protein ACFS5J_00130 [Flavobacterium chuncheonense]|uniref:Uncharacterized protein n=1 Tax=Flavobacterium chuncheonense TaxID=2026653 RepID=A0ABW5YIU3_9FLAO